MNKARHVRQSAMDELESEGPAHLSEIFSEVLGLAALVEAEDGLVDVVVCDVASSQGANSANLQKRGHCLSVSYMHATCVTAIQVCC